MKKSFITLTLICHTIVLSVHAQSGVYVVGGISPESNPVNANLIVNRQTPQEEFLFNMSNVRTQYFGGIKVRRDLRTNFFLETGVVFTQRKSMYNMKYTLKRELGAYQEMKETENQLIVPLSLGVRLNAFEFTSGVSAITVLSKNSELHHINGFNDQPKALQMGWHGGISVNLNKVLLGVEYQAALNRLGDGMTVNGQSLELMHVPGQCVFKIQYRL